MTMTTAITPPGSAPASPRQNTTSSFAGGDFETFLKMLTAQIRNQDPLNPMEGADFAVQLATFSGVEQQVRTNSLLEQMVRQGGADSLAAYTDWIGKRVRSSGPVHFGDQPIMMDITHDHSADRVLLVTKDQYGRRLTVEDIGRGEGLIEWYGRDAMGNRLPVGIYSLSVESYRGTQMIAETPVASYSTVQEIQHKNGAITFVLNGGATATLDQINALALG
ncbi:MAG: flagellar hook capping FlgD N-terminal domain-containing protein [Paracoccus sp. (in: a-proteobacteria)]|nr:flagellar hook capping FlgD N-terminal domain-containing protein [Paracoccus sp. (in: a-proteobacteria)]